MQIFSESAGHHKVNFQKILSISSRLRILSLKYCPNVNKDILALINNNCNPFTLSELYLDGCDQLSDDAFECLQLTEAETSPEEEQKAPSEADTSSLDKLVETLLQRNQDPQAPEGSPSDPQDQTMQVASTE